MAVACLAVLIGTSLPVEPCRSLDELGAKFAIGAISKSPAKFDPADLDALNAKLVRQLEWADVSSRFAPSEFEGRGAGFWPVVRDNLSRVADATEWWRRVIEARPVIAEEDRDYLALAGSLLPEGEFGPQTWGEWTAALKERSGRKGRALFMPLRLALTGMEHGPDMGRLLPLIGRERTLARLP